MKKKVLICIVLALIAIIACTMLVGCDNLPGGSNGDKAEVVLSPQEFLTEFIGNNTRYIRAEIETKYEDEKSESKDVYEIGINGNFAARIHERIVGYKDGKLSNNVYYELQKDKLIAYHYGNAPAGEIECSKYIYTLDEAKEEWGLKEIKSIADIADYYFDIRDYLFDIIYIEDIDWENDFTKNGNTYVGNKDSDYEYVTIELENKKMIIISENDDFKQTIILGIDYGKIIIPDEALNAEVQ